MNIEDLTIACAWDSYRREFLSAAPLSMLIIAKHCFYCGFHSSHVMRYEIHGVTDDIALKVRVTEALEAETRAFLAEHENQMNALYAEEN